MTPSAFIAKWTDAALRERQGSQEHFIDLCRLLGEPTPAEDDPQGERYCFERGALKVGGGDGWADVWRRGCFGWEYKGRHKNLDAALRQLQAYALDLENPPYLWRSARCATWSCARCSTPSASASPSSARASASTA